MVLGNLEKDGFKPKYSGGWGEWPVDYLEAVLTYEKARQGVLKLYYYESKTKPDTSSLDKAAGPIDIQAARARAKANYQNISKLPADFLGLRKL